MQNQTEESHCYGARHEEGRGSSEDKESSSPSREGFSHEGDYMKLWFKDVVSSVRAGNVVRAERWKNRDTSTPDWLEHPIKPVTRSFWPYTITGTVSKEYVEDLENESFMKTNSQYWDEWTGSRFERVENPKCRNGRVIRKNPVTGFYDCVENFDREYSKLC